jgi:2-polyprenyl-6-methoxyphenol hydroxylase-like FAD-dependent oxidoreductase
LLIVGAGIAGLSLAIALRRRGIEADIVERSAAPATEGAGMYLVGIATRALRELGLDEQVASAGQSIRTQQVFNHRGALLATSDVHAFWSSCGPCLGMARADLHGILAAQVPAIRYNVQVQALQQYATHVSVVCSDGSLNQYALVVGADGIRSTVRQLEFGQAPPVFRGQVSWRFIAPLPARIEGWSAYLGRGRTFLFVPIGNGKAYCYADRSTAVALDDPQERRLERLRAAFADFAAPVRETLAAMRDIDPIHFGPIEEVIQPAPGRGRVVLIGDAAHAMSPSMAAGAAMALEDAVVLADIVAAAHSRVDAVKEFLQRRAPRIAWIRSQTDRRDRMRKLAPLVRDLSLRLLWRRIYVANYGPLLAKP